MASTQPDHSSSVLLVTHPGRIRDGLRALLKTIPQIGSVYLASDGPSASQIIAQNHPVLVLLDSKLFHSDIQHISKQISSSSPETRCILLVDNLHQQSMAKTANADTVLLSGFSAKEFLVTVDKLLEKEIS